MTNFEAISAAIYPYHVDDNLIVKAAIDCGLCQKEEYAVINSKLVARATVNVLKNLVVLTGESNGGYTLSYDPTALKERIKEVIEENGLAATPAAGANQKNL